ncbi:MAG: M64 family metallo-endopeptidase [Firmicutes bacterium]|nr:M64 family metallo-endopeptidase [Bacillota bacterium]
MKNHLRKISILALLFIFAITPFVISLNTYDKRNVFAGTRYINAKCNCIDCECIECFCKDCCGDNIVRGGHHINDIRRKVGYSSGELVRTHTLYGYVTTKPVCDDSYEKRDMPTLNQSNFNSSNYEIITVHQGTNTNLGRGVNNGIVVVLLADGFIANEMGIFINHAIYASNFLISMYPFSLFSDLFTIHVIFSSSNQSGVSVRHGWPWNRREVDNVFGSYEPESGRIGMPRWGRNRARFNANYFFGKVDMIQVIANSNRFGGTAFIWDNGYYGYEIPCLIGPAVSVALTTVHNQFAGGWVRTFIHEFGHSFGNLADEHRYNRAVWETANLTTESNNTSVRWSHWVGHGDTGHGAIGVYRNDHAPSGHAIPMRMDRCLMSRATNTARPFCAVCSSELVRRMAQHHSGETFEPRITANQTHITVQQNPRNRILPYAFSGNTMVQHVTIPQGINSIGRYAFLGATNLRTILSMSFVAPPMIDNTTFAGLDRSRITVIVVPGFIGAFRNAGWTGFNIVDPHFFAGGSGTPSDPFLISNATHLNNIRYAASAYFHLTNNIYLTGTWTPIQTFGGTINGNNHVISGMNFTMPGTQLDSALHIGMIRNLTGMIRNLRIANSHVEFGPNHNGNGTLRAGILAGSIWRTGVVDNVRIENSHVITHRQQSEMGGLAGEVNGTVRNVRVINTQLDGNGDIGGVAGVVQSNGEIRASFVVNINVWYWRAGVNRSVGGITGALRGGSVLVNRVEGFHITLANNTSGSFFGRLVGWCNGAGTITHYQENNVTFQPSNTQVPRRIGNR